MCYNLQSIARAPVTIVSSSVDEWLGFVQPETQLPNIGLANSKVDKAGWTDLTT